MFCISTIFAFQYFTLVKKYVLGMNGDRQETKTQQLNIHLAT